MSQGKVIQSQAETAIHRRSIQSDYPDVFAGIYQNDINILIWQRTLSSELLQAAKDIVDSNHAFRFSASPELRNEKPRLLLTLDF